MRPALLLGTLALADVARQRKAQALLSLPELARTDLDREHSPVLAPVTGFESHRFAGAYSFRHPCDGRLIQAGIEVARVPANQLLAASNPGSRRPAG